MPEQFLHASQVGTVVQQMRREAVPKRVRADARIEAGLHQIFIKFAADRSRRERLAMLVQENAGLVGAVALGLLRAELESIAARP